MHFITEELDNYVVAHSENEPKLLQQLTRETFQKILLGGPFTIFSITHGPLLGFMLVFDICRIT